MLVMLIWCLYVIGSISKPHSQVVTWELPHGLYYTTMSWAILIAGITQLPSMFPFPQNALIYILSCCTVLKNKNKTALDRRSPFIVFFWSCLLNKHQPWYVIVTQCTQSVSQSHRSHTTVTCKSRMAEVRPWLYIPGNNNNKEPLIFFLGGPVSECIEENCGLVLWRRVENERAY